MLGPANHMPAFWKQYADQKIIILRLKSGVFLLTCIDMALNFEKSRFCVFPTRRYFKRIYQEKNANSFEKFVSVTVVLAR